MQTMKAAFKTAVAVRDGKISRIRPIRQTRIHLGLSTTKGGLMVANEVYVSRKKGGK